MKYYSAIGHTEIADICNNIDELRGYYDKLNKSDSKRPMLYDVIYMWNIKTTKKKLVNRTKEESGL